MSRNFVVRAAFTMVALMCALVVLESQADACFKRLRGRKSSSCCESSCASSCGCAAVAEPSCGCAEVVVEEPSCGCSAPEPSCGCESSCCDNGCGRKHRRLFGRRNNGCGSSCGCESSCGCASVEPSCGYEVVPSTSDDAPSMDAPPAPEASDAA